MLLTQSQVSLATTSGIFLFFTVLLLISGIIVQQRTVSSLQQTIKPRLPKAPPLNTDSTSNKNATTSLGDASSRFFRRDGSHIAYLDSERARKSSEAVDWRRLAHVQLARTHHDVCNAIMVLAELHRLKSPARRILLFPHAWAMQEAGSKSEPKDPYMDSTRRLMRLAARRYGVELRPVSPWKNRHEVGAPEVRTSLAKEVIEDEYSLASIFAFEDLDRALSLEAPGLLLDASPLDATLAFTEPAEFAMLHDTVQNDGVHSEDLILLQPSEKTYADLNGRTTTSSSLNDTELAAAFTDPLLLSSSSSTNALVRSIGTLHQQAPEAEFDRAAFLADVAYLRFSDPLLPGPEYDVPWSEKLAARPKNRDADWTWTKMYGTFAQKRMEVCGLDLETWRP